MKQVFSGIKQAVVETGLSKELLTRAKLHPDSPKGLVGFHQSNRIYWNIADKKGMTLKRWITDHTKELEHVKCDTQEFWKLKRLQYQTLALEEKLRQKRSKVLRKQDCIDTLERMTEAFKVVHNKHLRQPMIERWNLTPEQIEYLDSILAEINGVFDKQLAVWRK